MFKNKLLLTIVVIAALTRFVFLSSLPPALNRDEAAIGYNAYSILKTAKDEHGQLLPLAFKSIGDYKNPLYIYASVLPVKLFGLNDFSIRFWSALAGVVSVIATFFLTWKLVPKSPQIAFIASVLMALNPWAIFYSRIGFEANLSLAFFLAGLCLVIKGLKKLSVFFIGLLLLLLTLPTYSSSLIFIPLFLSLFLIFNHSRLTKALITLFYAAVVFNVTFLLPISFQKSSITIFSDPATIDFYNHTRTAIFKTNPILARTWWNKYVFFTRLASINYLKTFSFQFLLLKGGNHPWHQIPNMGYFYILELLFFIKGIWWLIKKNQNKILTFVLIAWLALAPLPSAITIDAPHATRSLYLLPIILIIASLGFSSFQKCIKKKKWLLHSLIIIYILNLLFFGYQYISQYPKKALDSLPVGLKQAIQYVNSQNLDGQVYLFNIHDSTYLYPLVYTQFDPSIFQSTAVFTNPDLAGLSDAYQFGNFTIVDDQKDIINPAAVIMPKDENPPQNHKFSSGNYLVL